MKGVKTKHKGIYRVGKNYYVTYYVGSKKYEKAVGPKLKNALKEKMERQDKAKHGNYKAVENQERMTFKELLSLYQSEGEGKRYILQFKNAYNKHFGEMRLAQIGRSDLFKLRDSIKGTPKERGGAEVTDSNVNLALAGLRRLFNFAVSMEYMEENPFPKTPKSGLFYSEQKGLRNFFTEDQMQKIIDASPNWLRPMVFTACLTGMRQGELLGLRWEWVDLQTGIIYLPTTKTLKDSTGRGQKIVMQRELIDLFQSLPKRSEWVFCRQDGTPYIRDHIYKPFKKVLRQIEIDDKKFSWKELRHTTASLMFRKGAPPLAIKDQLRHTDLRTTDNFYIGSDIEFQREQNEKLGFTMGKIVGKEALLKNDQVAEA